jgi:cell division transport system permease protein
MVGATKRFIRKPFIWNSVKLGIIGAILAIIELAILLYYLNKMFPEFGMIDNRVEMASLLGIVFGMGILITWASTFLATQRFLNLRTDELYF